MTQWFWKNLASAFTWISTLAFLGLLVFVANIEIKDLDLWLHLGMGRYISSHWHIPQVDILSSTMAGKAWINHEWLFQVIVFNVFKPFGPDGLHAMQAVIVGFCFILLFALGYRRRFHLIQLVLLAMVLLVFQIRLTLRPEIFSLFFFVFYIFVLTFHFTSPATRWVLFFMQVLWVNIHGFFILGPFIVFFIIVGEWLKKIVKLPWEWNSVSRLSDEEVRAAWKILGLLLLASLINPNFIEGAIYPFKVIFSLGKSGIFFENIIELQRPITWGTLWSLKDYPELKLLILFSGLSFLLNWRKLDVSLFIFWMATLFFALGAVRNIVYFAFVAYLCVMANLNAEFWKEYADLQWKKGWVHFVVILCANAAFLAWVGKTIEQLSFSGYYDFLKNTRKSEYGGISLRSYPFKAVDFLEENKIYGNFYNDFNSGAYLVGRRFPDIRVFIDGRTEIYGEDFFSQYDRIQDGDKALFDQFVEKYGLTGVFLNATKAPVLPKLFRKIYADPQWKLVYFDYDGAIFLRDIAFNRRWIKGKTLDLANWKVEKVDLMKMGTTTITPYQNLHRAFALYYLNLKDKALEEIQQALRISPNYDEVYYLKGRILYDRADYMGALENFRKAKILKPGDVETRYALGRTLYKLGNIKLAQEQAEKILSSFPRNSNALFLLSAIYVKQKLYDKAVEKALKAHEIAPRETSALMELGDLFLKDGQLEYAKKFYTMVLSVDKNHEKAKTQLLKAN